jgi:hypothetical protein
VTQPDRSTALELGLFDEPTWVTIPGQRKPRTTGRRHPAQPTRARWSTTWDLIETVLKLAREPDYVPVGESATGGETTVWRRRTRTGPEVDRAATGEVVAVRQLPRQGVLAQGGFHVVSRGRCETQARSVLVPDSTLRLSRRLGAYQRPAVWGPVRRATGEAR